MEGQPFVMSEVLDIEESRRIAETERAGRAKRLLDDDLLKEAIEAVKDRIWRDFASSPPGIAGDEARRDARLGLDVLDKILGQLRHHVQTGKLAQEQLGMFAKVREKLKRRA